MNKLVVTGVASAAVALAAVGCGGAGSSSQGSAMNGATAPAAAPPASPAPMTISTRSGSLGTYLVDSQGRAVYLFEADTGSSSTCYGACANAWPPTATSAQPNAGPGVDASKLGTTRRNDGTLEVTYAGHPLYYFAKDMQPGQTAGQGVNGFGAKWYVLSPAGQKIDTD